MKFFIKKKKRQEQQSSRIAEKILRLQRNWADRAQRQSERLSRTGKIIALAVFIIAGVAGSTLCLTKVMQTQVFSFRIGTIKRPIVEVDTFSKRRIKPSYGVKNRFQFFMDSLARSPGGKGLRDSLLQKYPGLLDSIALIERLDALPSTGQ